MGIVIVTAGDLSALLRSSPAAPIEISHYQLTFDGLFNRPGPNYRDFVGHFTVRRAKRRIDRRHGAAAVHSPPATWRPLKPR